MEEVKLTPAPGYALVRLGDYYEGVVMPEGKYDSKTEGKCLAIQTIHFTEETQVVADWYNQLIGKKIYWQEYKEGKRVTQGNVEYAFIKLGDIEGYESVERK